MSSSTERMRDLIARRKAGYEYPRCTVCKAKCTVSESKTHRLCSQCLKCTSEGRKKAIEATYRSINRRKQLAALNLNKQKLNWTPVDGKLPPHGQEVLTETLRGAWTLAKYFPDRGWVDSLDGVTTVKVRWWTPVNVTKVSEPTETEV